MSSGVDRLGIDHSKESSMRTSKMLSDVTSRLGVLIGPLRALTSGETYTRQLIWYE